jgi:propionyl-CoA synthetase
MLALPLLNSYESGHEELPRKIGSPGLPAFGFNLKIIAPQTGAPCLPGEKGIIVAEGPLPPGCLQSLWENDRDFQKTYWSQVNGNWVYSTFDWGVADEDGYIRVLGRSDDVINVAGRRLGTREIEEVILGNPAIAEVAVIGIPDALRGQASLAFVVATQAMEMSATALDTLEAQLMQAVAAALGSLARPRKIMFVNALPRTRSGKVLRRAIRETVEEENANGSGLTARLNELSEAA